ncbi:glycosyltransferase [Brevibacillus sp. H7]|uniref:glycosyltransferase n=1 Tax=Brevibacillus sp. H7 TaxID=3349138 RepID=UPI0038016A29
MPRRSKVAVIIPDYLPISQTFNYLELIRLTKVLPILCTVRTSNLDRFPFEQTYLYKNIDDLKKVLHKQKADLIHARFGTTGLGILGVKKELDLPMLTSFHGYDLPSNRRLIGYKNNHIQRLFEEGDAFTATSQNMKEILIKYGCPENKIFVHHSGIDIQRFTFKKRIMPWNKFITLLSVGRLVEKKGMRYLIDAFRKAHERYPFLRLRIVGDGHLRNMIGKQVRKLNLEDKVRFLGALPHQEVAKEMNKADLFALASITDSTGNQEGIPNVLKEAMASGLPVVSTWHAGIPELVEDGKSGFLVPERDSNALAQRILDLIHLSNQWGEMGKRGRKIVMDSFNVETQIEELERIYFNILQEKTTSRLRQN